MICTTGRKDEMEGDDVRVDNKKIVGVNLEEIW